MTLENTSIPAVEETGTTWSVPWSLTEIIFALLVIVAVTIGSIWIIFIYPAMSNVAVIVVQAIYLLPVVLIMLLRKARPEMLGLRNFSSETLALGCGMLLVVYGIVFVHNMLLMLFGIAPQGEYIAEIFADGEYTGLLLFAGVLLAPAVEEIFFRGFVFGGLRQKYDWKKSAAISALLFAAVHMQLVMMIPAFLMGFLFAYLYHRSRSILLGMILHFSVNAFGLGMLYLVTLLEPWLGEF